MLGGWGALLQLFWKHGVRRGLWGWRGAGQMVLPSQQPLHPGMSSGVGWLGLSPCSAPWPPTAASADTHQRSRRALSPNNHDLQPLKQPQEMKASRPFVFLFSSHPTSNVLTWEEKIPFLNKVSF